MRQTVARLFWPTLQSERDHHKWVDAATVSESRGVFPALSRRTHVQTASHVRQELLLPDFFEAREKVRPATFPTEQSPQHQNVAVTAVFSEGVLLPFPNFVRVFFALSGCAINA